LDKGPNEGSLTALEKAESDIIKSIFANLKDFKSVKFLWVKGHQDEEDDTPFEKRPSPVCLNIACDAAAKKCMRESAHPTTRPKPLERARATLYFGKTMVTTDMKAQIQFASQAPKMRAYICERLEWTDSQYFTVNWATIGQAKKRLKLHKLIRNTTKCCTRISMLASKNKRWDKTGHVPAAAWRWRIKCISINVRTRI
jgi:hypothetical protein